MLLLSHMFDRLATAALVVACWFVALFFMRLSSLDPTPSLLMGAALGAAVIGGFCDAASRRLAAWHTRREDKP